MPAKFVRLVAVLAVIVSIIVKSEVVRADSSVQSGDSAQSPRPPNLPALSLPAESSWGVQFVHIATPANIYASYTTIIDHPLTNGKPNAIIIVTPNDNPGNTGGTNNPHPIGVIYSNGKWAIFNQDIVAMPVGAAFNVIIPTAGAGVFVQKATAAGTSTDINSVLTDSHPNAMILVTPNYNPGGACPCVSASFHIGVEYHGTKWAIFTQDNSLMPLNAAFNVFVLPTGAGAFVQTATTGNTTNVYSTVLDNALTNGNPNAIVFATPNFNPGGFLSGTYDDHPTGLFYNGSKWEIYNQDLAAIQVNAAFNVLVLVPSSDVFVHMTTAGNGGGVAPYTIIDHALTNGQANAIVFTTPNFNPGGVGGTNNNNNIGMYFASGTWRILNQVSTIIPVGAAFNVLVPNPDASVFVHTATAANILSHSTVIDYPLTNGKPNAIILVTLNWNPGGVGGTYANHPIGVLYDGSKWRIYNENGGAMTVGTAFNVFVPEAGAGVFVHTATVGNSILGYTYIDNVLTNGNPNAMIIVTPNNNPGGVGGTDDNHPVGVLYDTVNHKWAIFNQDGGTMPNGAAFNVHVFRSAILNLGSIGTKDGWILESQETSNKAGTLNSTATTFRLGDDAADRQYRSILSFNTALIPDTAVITSATLKVKRPATGYLVGNNNPFTWGLGLKADICASRFGTTSALQLGDFKSNNAANCKLLAGAFGSTSTANWYSASIVSTAFAKINLAGLTQFRLYFKKDDNDDGLPDYLKFFSGNAIAASRPQLIIRYYVP